MRVLRAVLLCSFLFAAACGSKTSSTGSTDDDASRAAPGASVAPAGAATGGPRIQGFAYHDTTAKAGAAVTVTNQDDAPHTMTADDKSFTTGTIDAKKTGTFTAPAKAGSYPIHCEIHTSIKGALVVS